MLDQYDNPVQQETYYKQWLNLFNTAVIPLYREGTKPRAGCRKNGTSFTRL